MAIGVFRAIKYPMILYSFKPIGRQESPITVVLEHFNITHNKLIYIYKRKEKVVNEKKNK